ncbi:unnamed protein product [Vicia faba]|uniref:Uncharacterized protein n=1 Tax=Vicia faba TaxID=3906 RepID=A0AAV1A7C7_VICFA|nr:unnamed protein product [Vicia faba]
MERLRFTSVLCLMILTVEIVVSFKGDEMKNVTVQSQRHGNVTLETLSHYKENKEFEIRGKLNNQVVFNASKGGLYKRGGRGGGGGWWKWGCRNEPRSHVMRGMKHHHHHHDASNEEYRLGEFAECITRTRCKGMRLDCPLHCGGPCFYDCYHMCKAHCRRRP